MAYQTGASAGGIDILDKFRLFAISCGWTVSNWSNPATNTRWLHLSSAGGHHADFYWDNAGNLYGAGSTGYNGAAAYNAQPGRSGFTRTRLGTSGFPTYWMFGDAEQLMCVVEVSTGVHRHFGLGTVDKIGSYTGGQWVTSTQYGTTQTTQEQYHYGPFDSVSGPSWLNEPSTVFRCDIEGQTWWGSRNRTQGISAGGEWRSMQKVLFPVRTGMEDSIYERGPNQTNALTIFAPIRPLVERANSSLYSVAGTVRDIKLLNMSLLSPRDEITLGADTWMVFPVSMKDQAGPVVANGYNGSYNWAIAYKKVV